MVEWVRRLDDFDRKGWHNVCEIARAGPKVEYLGLVNRADDADDRVTCASSRASATSCIDRAGNAITRTGQPRDRHARRVLDARQARRPLDAALDRAGRRGRAPPRRRRSSPRRGPTTRACTTRRSPSSRSPTPCPTRRSPSSSTSTSTATRAPPRSTSRSSTAASRPTCWRPPRAGRSPRGPRRSTATTPRSSAPPRPRPCTRCSTRRRQRAHPARGPRPAAAARCGSPRWTPTRRRRR